jgi:hypothetical protein
MNALKYTLTIILFTSALSYSQLPDNWMWLNPKPQGNNLIALDFVNDNTGFAAGFFGTLLKTTDGGVNWAVLNVSTTKNLMSIFFLDANTGYAARFVLNKNYDGGQN